MVVFYVAGRVDFVARLAVARSDASGVIDEDVETGLAYVLCDLS